MGVGGQRHAPTRYTPGKSSRYPLCRILSGSQGRSGGVLKISFPPRFDPWTWATLAHKLCNKELNNLYLANIINVTCRGRYGQVT